MSSPFTPGLPMSGPQQGTTPAYSTGLTPGASGGAGGGAVAGQPAGYSISGQSPMALDMPSPLRGLLGQNIQGQVQGSMQSTGQGYSGTSLGGNQHPSLQQQQQQQQQQQFNYAQPPTNIAGNPPPFLNFTQGHTPGQLAVPNAPFVSQTLGLGAPLPPASISFRTNTGGGGGNNDPSLDDVLRAIDEALRMIERAEQVLADISVLESGIFRQVAVDAGEASVIKQMGGDLGRLEYIKAISFVIFNQLTIQYCRPNLLQSLVALSTTKLFGALPLFNGGGHISPSSDSTITAPRPDDPSRPPDTARTAVMKSTSDIIAWCEARSAADFARREGLRSLSRGVLEIVSGAGSSSGSTGTAGIAVGRRA